MSAGEAYVQRVLRFLWNPAVGRIILHGVSGVGKTWAARRVLHLARQGSSFDVAIWINLSAVSSLRQVQEMILEQLSITAPDRGGRDGGEESQTRASGQLIRAALSRIQFLLVLDDLWLTEDDVLAKIGIPAHDPAADRLSKVLVTTRSRRVLVTTQPDVLIEMAGLPFQESLGLFIREAGDTALTPSLRPLVQEVVSKCLGMPLAIVLAGRALRCNAVAGRGPSPESTLLMTSLILGHGTCNMVAHRAAKLGYRLLPSDGARELLLNCALIDDQCVGIAYQDLVRYCSSLLVGIMDRYGVSFLDDAHETGQAMITGLVNRRLLCEDGEGRVVVQKVVREVLLESGEASGENYLRVGPQIVDPPGRDIWQNYSTVSLLDTTIEALPANPGCHRLSTLLLNGSNVLAGIPERFFADMRCLRVLDLSETRIGHLPSSFCELVELRVLLLRRCVRLEEVANISSPKLEVLDLSGATLLKRIGWISSSLASPSLQVLNLSETSIEELLFLVNLPNLRQLVLSGCRRLKSVAQLPTLTNLELLDLSRTMHVGFPRGISKLTQLKRLRLVGSKCTSVEWRMIHWLPEGLEWDQSTGSDITAEPVQNADGSAFISANDSGVFETLDRDSPLWRNCFKKFHFSLRHPDTTDGGVLCRTKGVVFRHAPFKSRHFVHSEQRDRCLEICGMRCFPHGIEGVLCNSELLALNNVKSLKRLSEFGLANMRGMKECWIERCDEMEAVLDDQDVGFLGAEGSQLECLRVSNMRSLRCLFGKMSGAGSFACLKHLNIDCSPNLVCVFSSAVNLQNLETLQIQSCNRLETVFGDPAVAGEETLPRLYSVRLWQLPQLKYVCEGVLPALKKLMVRQCPTLSKIPVTAMGLGPLVRITGESWWWNNLSWDDQAIKHHLLFRQWGDG